MRFGGFFQPRSLRMQRRLPAFLLPLPVIIVGHTLCSEHELDSGAERVVLESSCRDCTVLVRFSTGSCWSEIRVSCLVPLPHFTFLICSFSSLPNKLGLLGPELFLVIMSLCRNVIEKKRLLQADRQRNPVKLDRSVYVCVIMYPITAAGGEQVREAPPETMSSSGLYLLRTCPSWEAWQENKSLCEISMG